MNLDDFLNNIHRDACFHCEGTGVVYVNPGKYLRRLRIADKIAQKDVAKKLMISATYLNDLEHDRRRWTRRLIQEYWEAIEYRPELD